MKSPICSCGSDQVYYLGIEDGGDYGDSVCDTWECQECLQTFEANCFGDDQADESDEGETGVTGNVGDPGTCDDDDFDQSQLHLPGDFRQRDIYF